MSEIDILIVEDDAALQEAIDDALTNQGYSTMLAENGAQALKLLEKYQARLVLSDVQMAEMDGFQLLAELKKKFPSLPVLLMTAFGAVDKAVKAIQSGAADYMTKPFEINQLVKKVEQTIAPEKTGFGKIPSKDSCMQSIVAMAGRVAKSEATVLVQGESGTGKEILARFIHKNSGRTKKPFVAINCAAIPENMLEAMLFGYEKGAFTGASQASPGKFEQAQGGTLLLDEVSEMNILLQAKLLRVLQEKEVERLGGKKVIPLDVRVIATTNRNLREFVDEGKFREDLLYRINVFPIQIPPLRDRQSDIPSLARTLIARHFKGDSMQPVFTKQAMNRLVAHAWRGNVRELENVVQRALIMMSGNDIQAEDLIFENEDVDYLSSFVPKVDDKGLNEGVRVAEEGLILKTLEDVSGSRKHTAERLGISPRTLRYKIAKMRDSGIQIPA